MCTAIQNRDWKEEFDVKKIVFALLGLILFMAPCWCTAHAADPQPAAEGSWITFVSHRTGRNLLYRMRADGTECRAIFGGIVENAAGIPDGKHLIREPHWTWQSPDRRHFASWTQDGLHPREGSRMRPAFHLYLGRTDGTGTPRIIAPLCEEAAAWSPDGKRLAFTVVSADAERGTGYHRLQVKSRIYVVAVDGSSE